MKEPFTPLGEAAVQMHELVLEYQRAGFTRAEAIQVVVALLKNAAAIAARKDGDAGLP